MNGETSIPPRSTITLDVINGDLEIGKHTIVRGTGNPPAVKVNGTGHCEGHNTFECSLFARELTAEDSVTIQGDLEVEEDIEIEDGRLEVYGRMKAEDVDVDDAVYVSKDLVANDVDVGGCLKVDGNTTAESIHVGGTFEAKGEVKAAEINIGGRPPH